MLNSYTYFLVYKPERLFIKLPKITLRQIKAGYNSRPGVGAHGKKFILNFYVGVGIAGHNSVFFARPLFKVGFYSRHSFILGNSVFAVFSSS